jgi:ferritin-like metal-binding protein YciE
MAAKEKTLSDAFYETLKDVYWAEKQGTRSLGKAAKAAKDPDLKKVFEEHREQSAHQIERLEQVFEIVGKTARAKTCEAMKGIAEEMTEDMDDFGDTAAADAVLIGCAQAAEHYEISRYGTLKSWARQLGFSQAEKLLAETLEEEKHADQRFSAIAERNANEAGGRGEIAEGEDEDADDEEAREELKGSEADEAPKGAGSRAEQGAAKKPARKKVAAKA